MFNLRYPGQYYGAQTGLYYNNARYYDPAIGRYLASDPIGLAGGVDTYAYVGSSPLNAVDPFGLDDIVLFRHMFNLFGRPIDHTALLTGNDKSHFWVYQSKDGSISWIKAWGTPIYSTAYFSTRETALQWAANQGYQWAAYHKSSPAQDKATRAAFGKVARSQYGIGNEFGSNCGAAVNGGVTGSGHKVQQ